MQKLFTFGKRKANCGLVLSASLCMLCWPATAQIMPLPPLGGQTDAGGHRQGEEPGEAQKEMLAKMQIKRNEARQQEIVRDTTKLLALATELKTDVEKTNKDVLSIDVIKKADEIEKLSKTIKDRMKN